jgi:CsoR family transcriptional regulator, copper-sensing transcriptional repressor
MADEQDSSRALILARLSRVEGQIRGIQRMIEAGRDCQAVVTQLMAARAALDSASLLILNRHLRHCLQDDKSADPQQLERILEFLLKLPAAAPGILAADADE